MEFLRLLLLCLLVAVWSLAAADLAAAQKPGCENTTWCSHIEVPYPYALNEECAIHSGFLLNCSKTNDGATKLFHGHGNLEVIKISVQDNKAWIKTWISRQCYDQATGGMMTSDAWMNIADTPFVLSAEDNKIIVLGCRSMAYMRSNSYVIGCLSTCEDDVPLKNGSCSGTDGCCQMDLPKGVRYYEGYFNPFYNTTKIWRKTPCNYVTVMESAAFTFSTTYVTSRVFYDKDDARTPVVMEWAITRDTCEEAKINKTVPYACVSDNSDCNMNDASYGCSCSKGYKGNPYIVGGCTDIDECQDNVTYPCTGICKKTPGSYTCSCPRGKSMNGGVCTKDQKLTWMVPVVGASIGLLVLVVAITCAYSIQDRQKLHRIKRKYFRQHGGLLLFQEMKSQQGVPFKIFSEEEVQEATKRFAEQQVIGHGGHGKVYKGVLKGDVEVAVKRCMTIDEQQKKEFGKEMLILSQINHRNIVKLLGCCLEVEVPMLVYEFVTNGTLFHLIHDNHSRRISLDTRVRIGS